MEAGAAVTVLNGAGRVLVEVQRERLVIQAKVCGSSIGHDQT